MKWLLLIGALLGAASCIDFQEAENHYCATHPGCPDGGPSDADAGQ
ncbi:MAG: hypothetical protein IPJ65_33815 [Archangiaceae bacterium]|nr:hypothetical protein [Archangiaceae bacterium]